MDVSGGTGIAGVLLVLVCCHWLMKNYSPHLTRAKDPFANIDSHVLRRREEIRNFLSQLFAERKLSSDSTYEESASVLKEIITWELVSTQEMIRKDCAVLLDFHREMASMVEGGLAVRITVQYNLFGGTIANLGSPEQRDLLEKIFKDGQLGCFALTEAGAGVLSGLVVETTATWTKDHFVLDSPDPIARSKKTWISQGLIAQWGVLIARLILPEGDKGPHAFLVNLASTRGVFREDMKRKVTFNGLDNAEIWFKNAEIPHESLLSGISFVNKDGAYRLRDPKIPFRFEHVAQRLLSGRVCLAGSALSYLTCTFDAVESYALSRDLPAGKNSVIALSHLPRMRDLIFETRCIILVLRTFLSKVEERFLNDPEISPQLVHWIACAKVICAEFAIDSTQELKKKVGSLALMEHGPFGAKTDILFCLRFAEGDSSILQQKMSRDYVKRMTRFSRLIQELFSIPICWLRDSGRVNLFRLATTWKAIVFASYLSGIPKQNMLPTWMECYSRVECLANRIAVLTIFDVVSPILQGSKELQVFESYFMK